MNVAKACDDFVKTYCNFRISSMFFVGFSCGVPFLMTLGILDIWMKECGVSNTVIGLFTLFHLPFTLKFLWGPFIDKLNFPFLSKKLGRRRGWAVASQLILFCGLIGMSMFNPSDHIVPLMLCASIVAFADGCQTIALYAYQLNKASSDMLGPIAGVVIFGYRIGLFFAKSISLYLAWYYSWAVAYQVIAVTVFIGTIFILCVDEPEVDLSPEGERINLIMHRYKKIHSSDNALIDNIRFTFFECLICPFKLFIKKTDWKFFILLIMFFKAGDFMMQKMCKPFLIDIGFSKLEIANVVQVFGTIAALIGGIMGGYLIKQAGLYKAMFFMSIAHALSCISYMLLLSHGQNINILYMTVFIENITGGAMATTFLAFLYSLCYTGYPATQYALLWAFHECGGIIFRSMSGIIVDIYGWKYFFFVVQLVFIPGIIMVMKLIPKEKPIKAYNV